MIHTGVGACFRHESRSDPIRIVWYTGRMNDDQFMKLFTYMEKRFDEVDKRFEAVDARFDHLEKVIDGYAAKLDTYAQEMAGMQFKLNRLEKYIQVLADKAGVDLDAIRV